MSRPGELWRAAAVIALGRCAALVPVLCLSTCCRTHAPKEPAADGAGLEIDGDPDCGGESLAWNDATRAEARMIIERSLPMPAMTNDLAIGDSEPEGLIVYVILPDGVEPPRLAFVKSATDVSTTNAGVHDVWFWKIQIRERHRHGAILMREQTVVSPGGKTAYGVSLVCAALNDGVPIMRWYGGYAD